MAQHRKDAPADTLEALESIGDRMVHWVSANPALVLGAAAAVLLLAATVGGVRAWRASTANEASAELATLHSEYVVAMGGEATDLEAPEPANPETARTVRTEYVERFVSLAKEHEGTPAQVLAAVEASRIYEVLGASDRAREIVEEAAAAQPSDSPIRAVALRRSAVLQEAAGAFEAAAQAHLAAAETPGYPLRIDALADAARCWAEAGKTEEAIALYGRIQSEAPDHRLAPHLAARLAELQARAAP